MMRIPAALARLARVPVSALPAFVLLLPMFFLGGCSVGHPFADPGGNADRLAIGSQPPARLAVLPPAQPAGKAASDLWANDMVVALLGQSLPAVHTAPAWGDWVIKLGVRKKHIGEGSPVRVPFYKIMDATGQVKGKGEASPMDDAAWQAADPQALNLAALQMAPEIAHRLSVLQTQSMAVDPNSLMNRPAHIYFAGVTGAPGDGDAALGSAFVTYLSDAHNQVQRTLKGADYVVYCQVKLTPVPPAGPTQDPKPEGAGASGVAPGAREGGKAAAKTGAQVARPPHSKRRPAAKESAPSPSTPPAEAPQQITLIWHVTTGTGKEAGAATQLHEIAPHSLDGAWGGTAQAAAQEAADGVRTIISNYSGRNRHLTDKVAVASAEAKPEIKPETKAGTQALAVPPAAATLDALQPGLAPKDASAPASDAPAPDATFAGGAVSTGPGTAARGALSVSGGAPAHEGQDADVRDALSTALAPPPVAPEHGVSAPAEGAR